MPSIFRYISPFKPPGLHLFLFSSCRRCHDLVFFHLLHVGHRRTPEATRDAADGERGSRRDPPRASPREREDVEDFHNCKVAADGRMEGIFWASADSGIDYLRHGDVVVFDTTFRTNRYGAPFVPFLGINHHRRPVVFG